MIPSLNAYGGLSSSLVLKLFDTPSASSSGSASATQPSAANAPTAVSAYPASAIKAISAESKIAATTGGEGWSITETAEAAYASHMNSASVSASTTTSKPGTVQQINQAVALIHQTGLSPIGARDPALTSLDEAEPLIVSASAAA